MFSLPFSRDEYLTMLLQSLRSNPSVPDTSLLLTPIKELFGKGLEGLVYTRGSTCESLKEGEVVSHVVSS